MKLFEIKTKYTHAEDMTPALEKVRSTLPYEETTKVINQKKLVE